MILLSSTRQKSLWLRRLAAWLFCYGVFFFSAASASAQASATSYAADQVTVVMHPFGIGLAIPATYGSLRARLFEREDPASLSLSVFNDQDATVLIALFQNYTQKPSLEEALADDIADYRKAHSDAVFITENREEKIGGTLRGLSLIAKSESKGRIEKHFLFAHAGTTYYLAFTASEKTFPQQREVFRKIVDSITFFPPNRDLGVTIYDAVKKGGLTAPNTTWDLNVDQEKMVLKHKSEGAIEEDKVTLKTRACEPQYERPNGFEAYKRDFLLAYPEAHILHPRAEAQVGPYAGNYFNFIDTEKNWHRAVLVSHDGWCYSLQYTTELSRFEQVKADFLAISGGVIAR